MRRLESSTICKLAHRRLCPLLKSSELWDIALSMAASASPPPCGSRLRSSGRSKNSTELAPLHNPASLDGINAVEQVLPKVPQVAAFDTAFHATLSEAARTYPLPQKWTREWGIRRYGFHGLSHSYCAGQAAKIIGRQDLRLVIAHLGNGASVSAVRDGVCVDTSMGFTPLEGLMMANAQRHGRPGHTHLPFTAQETGRRRARQRSELRIRFAR